MCSTLHYPGCAAMLEARALGRTGLTVSRLGFGGAAIGIESYLVAERRDDDAVQARARAALEAALAEGITLFDTAPGYGFGRSERLFGEVLAPHRDRIVLATKVKVEPGHKSGRLDPQRRREPRTAAAQTASTCSSCTACRGRRPGRMGARCTRSRLA